MKPKQKIAINSINNGYPFFAFLQNKMLRLSVARLRNGYFMFISSNYSSLILLAVK